MKFVESFRMHSKSFEHIKIINSSVFEDIKEEIKLDEGVEDPIHQEAENIYGCENIKEEIKEEDSVENTIYENIIICEEIKEDIAGRNC